jgi:signal peptidase I
MPPAPDPPGPSVAEPATSAPVAGGGADPWEAAPRSSWLRDLLEVLLIALVLYAVIWTCIETVRVDGQSMDNTLHDGDFLIASKISYVFGNPQRGDIVILDPPHSCDAGAATADYVKRVVGLPGDNLEVTPATATRAGQLYVEPGGRGPWEIMREPYLPETWEQGSEAVPPNGIAIGQVVHVPAATYVVFGDNRNESCDSRVFGLVARDRILAKAILRVWPLSTFGGLGPGPTLVVSATPQPAAGMAIGLLLACLPLRDARRRLRRRGTGP